MTDVQTVVRVQRTIPAPPESVCRAWLDPELMRQWLAPGSMNVSRAEVDERVGGRYRVWHAREGDELGGFESEVLELEPARRIVFLWRFVGPDRVADPSHDSLLTLTFEDAPGGSTLLTLVHERLEALEESRPGMAASAKTGWTMVLDDLAERIGELT